MCSVFWAIAYCVFLWTDTPLLHERWVIYFSAMNLCFWLFETPLYVDPYIYIHMHTDWKYLNFCSKLKVSLENLTRFMSIRSWCLICWLIFCTLKIVECCNCFWFWCSRKSRTGIGQPCLWHLCKYAIYYAWPFPPPPPPNTYVKCERYYHFKCM